MLSERDFGWIVGFLEGEGHFRFSRNSKRGGGTPLVTADQKQRLPLDRLVRLVGGTIYFYKSARNIHVWQIRGKDAVGLMFTLYSELSPYRRMQIGKAIAEWKTIRPWKYLRFCKRGHEYTPENTYLWKDGYKRCKICESNRRKRSHLKVMPGSASC